MNRCLPDGNGIKEMGKKGKGRSTNWQLQNSHGNVKDGIGNIVNNTVIIMYGVGWVLDLPGDH